MQNPLGPPNPNQSLTDPIGYRYNLECKFPPSSNVVIPTETKWVPQIPTAAESPAIVATK